jgi:hypothetical protein
VSGTFQVGSADYQTELRNEAELARFLDFLLAAPMKPATSRMYLHLSIYPLRPERYASNLRLQFDMQRQVAAAVLLAINRAHDQVLSWMTAGEGRRRDDREVVLAHDSWNEHETLFQPGSFITIPDLRRIVTEWAFGDVVPPLAVRWVDAPGIGWL